MDMRPRQTFWLRTRRLTLGLLVLWLAINLAVPWFARELDTLAGFGFPLGYWLSAEGALLLYLLIIVVYVLAMDRLEARLEADEAEEATQAALATASAPASAADTAAGRGPGAP